MYLVLAEFIVAIHILYIAAVVVGLLLIVLGTVLRWQWIRNPWFRLIHLSMILFVAFEAMIDYTCPLTTWENELRVLGGQHPDMERSFTSRLMEMILHPEWANREALQFWVYGLSLLILVTFLAAPPRWRRRPRPAVKAEPPADSPDGHAAPAAEQAPRRMATPKEP